MTNPAKSFAFRLLLVNCNPKSNSMNHHDILEQVKLRNPNEPEFIQAAEEVITTLAPVLDKHPELGKLKILERILEQVSLGL